MSESDLPELRVQLFGGPILLAGGEEVPLSPYQSYLLALVYGHGPRGISRSKAAWLLWEEDDSRDTRHRLSQLTHLIGKKVGGRKVMDLRVDHLIGLIPSSEVDLWRFHKSCTANDLHTQPFDLPRLLDRIDRSPSPSYANWRKGFIEAERKRAIKTWTTIWDSSEALSDWVTAKIACTNLLAARPDDPSLMQNLARLHLRTGEVRTATRLVAQANALDPEGLAPTDELRRLLSLPSDWEPQISEAPFGSDVPTVGREREIGIIFNELRSVRGPAPIIVTGETGIGKTRICHEVVGRIQALGYRVLQAKCAEFERGIALNAILEALCSNTALEFRDDLPEPWRSVLTSLVPGSTPGRPPPEISASSAPRRLFEALRQLLLLISKDRPTLLLIDNFQWIDATSIAALQYVIRRSETSNLRLLLILRSESLHFDATEANRFVGSLVRDGARSVHIDELSTSAARRLINEVKGTEGDRGSTTALLKRAGGHPLFLVELAAQDPQDPGLTSVPPSLNNIIEARITSSSPLLKQILQILSLSGSATLDLLATVAGCTLWEAANATEEGVERRLLCSEGSVTFNLRHEVVTEVIRGRMRGGVAASLHAAIARHLESEYGEASGDRIAEHYYRAGDLSAAATFALMAAGRAEKNGAVPEAVHFLEMALQCVDTDEEEAALLARVGHLRFLQTEMDKAAPILEVAAVKHRALGLQEASLRLAVESSAALSEAGLRDHRQCLAELDRVEREALGRQLTSIVMAASEAKVRIWERLDCPDRVGTILQSVKHWVKEMDGRAAAEGHMLLALEIFYGDSTVAMESTAEAVALAQKLDDPYLRLKAALRRFLVLIYQGRAGGDEGLRLLRALHEESHKTGDLRLKHTALVNEGVWQLETKNLAGAEELFLEAQAVNRGVRTPHDEIHHLGNLGATHLETGDLARAEQLFREARSLADTGVRRVAVYFLEAGLGLCLIRQGKIGEARVISHDLPIPRFWYYDPTYIALLRSEVLRAEQRMDEANKVLEETGRAIKGRMVPQWLTLQEALIRNLRRCSRERAAKLALEARGVCLRSGLTHRAGAFSVPIP